ncbi:MAG TPA: DUF4159 domain-containing protein [Patescibacteria group bacterium]|nr:DUF4159 domain-containing protein [Patescibacteria group bacterium]
MIRMIRRHASRGAAVLFVALLAVSGSSRWAAAQHVQVPPGGGADTDVMRERRSALGDVRVRIARVKYGGGGDWYSDPSSLPNLLREFGTRTGIPTAETEKVLELGEQDLFAYPFLYMTGHGNIRFTGEELSLLRRHLLGGGFLYADDNYGMDRSFRAMVTELFPERRLVPVPFGHPIYHAVYDLDGPPKIHEHDGKPPQGLGVFDGDRLVIFYTYESDIGDGLEDPDVHGDPPEKREQAIRMAVNVLYYALTQ